MSESQVFAAQVQLPVPLAGCAVHKEVGDFHGSVAAERWGSLLKRETLQSPPETAFAGELSLSPISQGSLGSLAEVGSTESVVRDLGSGPGSATDLNASLSESPVSSMVIYTRDDKRLPLQRQLKSLLFL